MEKTTYPGINYSFGKVTNCDTKTGIRYGVIPMHALGEHWFEDSEIEYPEHVDATCEYCACMFEVALEADDLHETTCLHCKEVNDFQYLYEEVEPCGMKYVNEGYAVAQTAESTDLWILKSPYYTYAQFCSPCAPGACYLMNPLTDKIPNNKCYCLGPDWFEDDTPPYPVYTLDGREVFPTPTK